MAETKLLLDEYPLIVLPRLAVAVGLNEAIVLQQIHYWLENFKRTEGVQPEGERPHFKDGRWWVYNTMEEWQEQFPFWSYRTVRRALECLRTPGAGEGRVEHGPLLITSSAYNPAGFDRTLWYTVDYAEVERLEEMLGQMHLSKMDKSNCPKWTNGRGQNGQMHLSKMSRPIPETTTETTAETTQETTATESSRDEKKPRLTGNDVVVDVVVPDRKDDSLLKEALADTGIKGRKKQEILRLDDPPHNWDVYGWAYYAYAQEWSSNPPGVIIEHLLDPDERHHPPQPFKQFGVEHLSPVIAARALAEVYRQEGYGYKEVVSSLGDDCQEEWREYFGQCTLDELPLPNPAAAMWRAESRVLEAGLDRPAGPDVCLRWGRAWQDFVSRQTPVTCELWSEVNTSTTPLGYCADVLVVYASDVVVRSTVEEHRPELEAAIGERIQFTAVELSVPEGDGEQEGEGDPAVDDSVNAVIRGNWTAGRVWNAALGELQLQMTQATFDTWLRDSELLSQEEGVFTIGVKNGYAKDWLENRLLHTIKRTLARLAGQPVEVRFTVLGD